MSCIGINAQLLSGESGYRRAGIHHYIVQVLRHLPADRRLQYLLYSSYDWQWPRPDMRVKAPEWGTQNRVLRILWEQSAWPISAYRAGVDLLHSTAFVTPFWSPCPSVVTVYDLSFIQHAERFPTLQRIYLTTQTRRSVRQARRVIAISEAGRDDLHRIFGVPLEKIDVAAPGLDDWFRPLPAAEVSAFRQQKGLPERFILHVGTLQPRKNIPVLLEAMARLKERQLPLVLVGGKGWMYDEIFARIEALGLQKRVFFAGYVPDEELPLWYNAASMLVFPSVYEGYGMPIVQALACGTPVIASDTSAMPEAVGPGGLLFAPHDVDQLVEHIETVLTDEAQVERMVEDGLRHAGNHSWARAAQRTAEAYLLALAVDQS